IVSTPPTVFCALLLLPDEPPPQAPASSVSAASELSHRSRRLIPHLLKTESLVKQPPRECGEARVQRRGRERLRGPWRQLRAGRRRRPAPRPRPSVGTAAAGAALARSAPPAGRRSGRCRRPG